MGLLTSENYQKSKSSIHGSTIKEHLNSNSVNTRFYLKENTNIRNKHGKPRPYWVKELLYKRDFPRLYIKAI